MHIERLEEQKQQFNKTPMLFAGDGTLFFTYTEVGIITPH